jgi:hypothetical protein
MVRSDAASYHRQLRRPAYQDALQPSSTPMGFLKIVTSVEALAPPALLQGRDQAWSDGALASILREEGHDTRPL